MRKIRNALLMFAMLAVIMMLPLSASANVDGNEKFLLIEPSRQNDEVAIQSNATIERNASGEQNAQGLICINRSLAEYNSTDLSQYATDDLLVFILNNHRSMVSMLYSHAENPYESARSYYHGLTELEEREDALSVLQRALDALETAERTSDEQRIIYDMRVDFLKMVLDSDYYANDERLLGDAANYSTENALATIYSTSNDMIGAYGFLYDHAGTVYTMGNRAVDIYSATTDYYNDQKTTIMNRLCSAHPQALYLAEATSAYNGFSYAWYLSTSGNSYCIFDISQYLSDPHTQMLNLQSWTECQEGDIVVYINASGEPIHAGVVTWINDGEVNIISKWDSECLMRHSVADVPDYMYINANIGYFRANIYRITEHNHVPVSYDNTSHVYVCEICGDESYSETHTWEYQYCGTNNETHQHIKTCTVCGKTSGSAIACSYMIGSDNCRVCGHNKNLIVTALVAPEEVYTYLND